MRLDPDDIGEPPSAPPPTDPESLPTVQDAGISIVAKSPKAIEFTVAYPDGVLIWTVVNRPLELADPDADAEGELTVTV